MHKANRTTMSKLEKGEYEPVAVIEGAEVVKPVKVKRSFFWRTCLCYSLAILLGLVLLTFTGTYLWTRHQVRRFTISGADGVPTFASHPLPREDLVVVMDQAKLFYDTLRAGRTPENDLVLTQESWNGFIADSDYLNTHAAVEIKENHFQVDLALPVDQLPGGKGRYFVATGTVQVDDDTTTESTRFAVTLTPRDPVPDLDHDTLLLGKFVVKRDDPNDIPVLQATYGQLLNGVIPDEWLQQHPNLLTCDWDCHHHGHHHHHHDHHGRKLLHGHDHHHHHESDQQDCEAFMALLSRLRFFLMDGKIVVHADSPPTTLLGGGRFLLENVPGSIFSKRSLARRMRAALF